MYRYFIFYQNHIIHIQPLSHYYTFNTIFNLRNIILPYKYNNLKNISLEKKINIILNDSLIISQWENEYKQSPRKIDHEFILKDSKKKFFHIL